MADKILFVLACWIGLDLLILWSCLVARRRPVPRAWREEHHELGYGRTKIAGGGWGGWSRTYRYGATCSCGKRFGLDADDHTKHRADVIEDWLDHVESTYYEEHADG
jgi:hypothetical protein